MRLCSFDMAGLTSAIRGYFPVGLMCRNGTKTQSLTICVVDASSVCRVMADAHELMQRGYGHLTLAATESARPWMSGWW